MNKLYLLLPVLWLSQSRCAQAQDAPLATLTFRAVSDFGKPIAGAEIRMTTFVKWEPGEAAGRDIYDGPTGITNSAGLVTLSVPCARGEIKYGGYLTGYYRTAGATFKFEHNKSGVWLPVNPTVEVVIKPILNPVPVFARQIRRVSIPTREQPVGFDLMKSDWVAPYGKGVVEDFVFMLSSDYTGSSAPFQATLQLRFSNDGDGIQSVFAPSAGGSALKLPRYAPEDGYVPLLLLKKGRASSTSVLEADESETQTFFFRVRTKKQADGKILSALYGKISGNIEFWGNGDLRFAYYLNPEPSSRNMEFDMQRNQIKGLRGFEAIGAP